MQPSEPNSELKGDRKHTVAAQSTMSIAPVKSSDDSILQFGIVEELGYVSIYRRVFHSLGNVCMVTSLTSPLVAVLITANYQISYAGYWGLSWGWIIPSLLVFPEVLAIAELASSMPLNGSFYWWSGALAAPQWSNLISFVSGWLNVLSMFSATAAFAYAVASTIVFSVNIALPDLAWTNAQIMGLSLGVLFVWAALMSLKLETISLVFMTMAGLVLVQTIIFTFGIPISHKVQGRPFASGRDVFGTLDNFSDWGLGVAIPYSWFAFMWVNSAWMCPVYVAEETQNAPVEIPKSIVSTYLATTVAGLVVCLISAFCITDISAYAHDWYPLVNMIDDHWGQKWSAAFLLSMLPIGIFGGSGTLVTYSSQVAAFARDRGLPYSERFTYVHPRINLPIYSVLLLTVGTGFILLFSLSEEASSIIYSLSVAAGLITFILPVALRIFAGSRWVPGPFSLGRWSIPTHILSVLTQGYFIIMECFPPHRSFTLASMNWNSVVTTASILFSLCLYWAIGKKYRGIDQEAVAQWRAARVQGA